MMLRPVALAVSLCGLVAAIQAMKLTTFFNDTLHPDLTHSEFFLHTNQFRVTDLVVKKMGPIVLKDAIAVPSWYGRLGNNLMQMAKALMKAEILGKSRVTLPKNKGGGQGTFSDLFNVPKDGISITPNEEMKSRVQCVAFDKPAWVPFQLWVPSILSLQDCSNFTVTDISRLLSQYVRPLLKDEGKKACKAEAASVPEHELIIHLRNGDLAHESGYQGRFAPCDFYDMIIDQHGFKSVRVVTEPDRKHVCIKTLPERNPTVNVTVQSKSLAEDACALLEAKHVAYGSLSTFSLMLTQLNKNLQSVYSPLRQDLMQRQAKTAPTFCETNTPMKSFTEACPPKAAAFYEYCIPDWNQEGKPPAKWKWMLSPHRSKIRLDRCEDVAVWRG